MAAQIMARPVEIAQISLIGQVQVKLSQSGSVAVHDLSNCCFTEPADIYIQKIPITLLFPSLYCNPSHPTLFDSPLSLSLVTLAAQSSSTPLSSLLSLFTSLPDFPLPFFYALLWRDQLKGGLFYVLLRQDQLEGGLFCVLLSGPTRGMPLLCSSPTYLGSLFVSFLVKNMLVFSFSSTNL